MTSKLYVGNLPFATTAQELQDLFSQTGEVSAVDLIFDKFTGRSRGFAFVNMASSDDARKAMDRFNGFDVGGRSLTVNEARPKESRPRVFPGGGDGPGPEAAAPRRDDRRSRNDYRGERSYRG